MPLLRRRPKTTGIPRPVVVLLVEDDPDIREITAHVLPMRGFNVLTAQNAADAILTCRIHPGVIDLLLTDLEMPGVSGAELARCVAHERPGIHAVYFSGIPQDIATAQYHLDPQTPYLTKPYSGDALCASLQAMLPEHVPSGA